MKRLIIIICSIIFLLSGISEAQQKTTQIGIDVIKNFEGIRYKAYRCPANVWTIGIGHTGNDVYKGLVITNAEAELLLVKDLVRFETHVKKSVRRLLRWNEFDALVSFSFNVGFRVKGNLQKFVNEGDTKTAMYILRQYNKARVGGVLIILPGLVKRRAAESFLYETGDEKILRQKYLTNLKK